MKRILLTMLLVFMMCLPVAADRGGDNYIMAMHGGPNWGAIAITGGTIDGTPIGGTTPAAGAFTTVAASSTITGMVKVSPQTGEYAAATMTSEKTNLGGIIVMTTASDVNLPVAAVGQSFKVIVRDASETVSIRPYTGDTIVYPGISPVLDASDELDSPGGALDELTCQCVYANIWYCNGTSGWTDGGAGD